MDNLSGKVVVLIGAGVPAPGWGNGNACAALYARRGASVVCFDYVEERAVQTANLIETEGGTAIAIQGDATKEADVKAAVSLAVEKFGGLDIMHNNVGMGGLWGAPDEIKFEDWNSEIAQNLTSAYLGTRCAIPALKARGGGSILNISSLFAVRYPRKPVVAYTVGKAGVEALTRSCAVYYGPQNIRVNCIRIGFSETTAIMHGMRTRGLSDVEIDRALEKTRSKVPLNAEHGDPFDVAEAAVFLASDKAKHISGVILNVDGALEAAPI